jgi:hypothetical protein
MHVVWKASVVLYLCFVFVWLIPHPTAILTNFGSMECNVMYVCMYEIVFWFLNFQCSKSCGEGGYQHRQVRCQSHTGEILVDTFCSVFERPNERHTCALPQCHISNIDSNLKPVAKEYQWRTGIWSQVSFVLYLLRTYLRSCLHNRDWYWNIAGC